MSQLTQGPRFQNRVPSWSHFLKIGAGMAYTVELISMSSFQKYINFPILEIPPRKYPCKLWLSWTESIVR
jgi:hypothetical protein